MWLNLLVQTDTSVKDGHISLVRDLTVPQFEKNCFVANNGTQIKQIPKWIFVAAAGHHFIPCTLARRVDITGHVKNHESHQLICDTFINKLAIL